MHERRVVTFFMTTTAGCQKDGFVFGFSIGKLPVIFAEFCFDLLQMKTIFVHYVATARVPYLEKQLALNPGNITGSAVFFLTAITSKRSK